MKIRRLLGIEEAEPDLRDWLDMLDSLEHPTQQVSIAVCGKYIYLQDAYKSIAEALVHAGIHHQTRVDIHWVDSEKVEAQGSEMYLRSFNGILVPGGFGMRGIEGKVEAVKFARQNDIPFFGICLGLQSAIIEYARNELDLERANSIEFDSNTLHPVICLMDEQKEIVNKGGTMRLGLYPCYLNADSLSYQAYSTEKIEERHRHRYEVNPQYRELFEEKGIRFAGNSQDGKLAEIIEIRNHPWFVAVQFHPEFKSRPLAPHPLFCAFVQAALEHAKKS
jgi:CTP synthase